MKCQILLVIFASLLSCSTVHSAPSEASNDRQARQLMSNGASTLTVDSLGTPVMTTAVDAMGGTPALVGANLLSGTPAVVGGTYLGGAGLVDPLGLGFGLNVANPNLATCFANTGTTLMDTSGLGSPMGLTATMGEAVGNIDDLIPFYTFTPVDTSNSFYVLPQNLCAYIPDSLLLLQSPPTYDNYIFACDTFGTRMCYYYYF